MYTLLKYMDIQLKLAHSVYDFTLVFFSLSSNKSLLARFSPSTLIEHKYALNSSNLRTDRQLD